jgi:hypothetical protein
VSTPIQFGGVGMSAVTPARTSGPAGTGFAQRMSGLSALASGVQVIGQNLGRAVIATALSGLPPVVQNMAQNVASAATGGALGGEDAAKLDVVDKMRTFIMMNAIFDAANAPIVDRV